MPKRMWIDRHCYARGGYMRSDSIAFDIYLLNYAHDTAYKPG